MNASCVFLQMVHGGETTITMTARMLFRFRVSYANVLGEICVCDKFFVTKWTCEGANNIRMRFQVVLKTVGGKIFVAQRAQAFAVFNVFRIGQR